ncbi:hypothetical protein [Thalassobacillus hwangdonensis]|uniref:Uncharacterized protein n=1 Tax=Thalassobacillus hwangdonensis TaxID=546108 RepID=A0ABW3KW31_9BACI
MRKSDRGRFDEMMFGRKNDPEDKKELNESEDSPFDWVTFMQTMSDTYQSFSPYVKQMSEKISKFKGPK